MEQLIIVIYLLNGAPKIRNGIRSLLINFGMSSDVWTHLCFLSHALITGEASSV